MHDLQWDSGQEFLGVISTHVFAVTELLSDKINLGCFIIEYLEKYVQISIGRIQSVGPMQG